MFRFSCNLPSCPPPLSFPYFPSCSFLPLLLHCFRSCILSLCLSCSSCRTCFVLYCFLTYFFLYFCLCSCPSFFLCFLCCLFSLRSLALYPFTQPQVKGAARRRALSLFLSLPLRPSKSKICAIVCSSSCRESLVDVWERVWFSFALRISSGGLSFLILRSLTLKSCIVGLYPGHLLGGTLNPKP